MVLRRLGLAACCAMMVALVSAAGARAAEGDDARIAALLGLSDARIKAVVEADTQQLSALLSDDLRYTHSNGSVDTKDEFIAALTSGRSNYHSFAPFDRVFTFPAPGIALESGKALIAVEGTAGKLDALFGYLAVWREEQRDRYGKAVTRLAGPAAERPAAEVPAPLPPAISYQQAGRLPCAML